MVQLEGLSVLSFFGYEGDALPQVVMSKLSSFTALAAGGLLDTSKLPLSIRYWWLHCCP